MSLKIRTLTPFPLILTLQSIMVIMVTTLTWKKQVLQLNAAVGPCYSTVPIPAALESLLYDSIS